MFFIYNYYRRLIINLIEIVKKKKKCYWSLSTDKKIDKMKKKLDEERTDKVKFIE